ncbi:ATP-binding protein [Larkinella sp. C7]|uniref:hybrid sensor histidine kinase/response regulator transcription factor n=1 Tax=Larkinella sp. C7 TaxID=2576607 RepID=UPI001486C413|nr:ATP-binding protein [Larkinella sp. C7]
MGLLLGGGLPIQTLVAQSNALPPAESLTERQGLPQAFVSSIVQDRQGFIWMATRDGLCRYDGQRFRVFQVASPAKTALSFPDVYNLTPDRDGHIWIKSEQNKMDRLDPATETFRNITREPFYRRHFGRDTLWDLCPDSRNRVWLIFRNNGLVCWDLRTNHYRRFRHTGQRHSLRNNVVRDVREDRRGNIWVTSDGGLDRFDESQYQFIHYPLASGKPVTWPDSILGRMHARKNGDLLIHSRQHLTLLHTKTGQIRVFPLPPLGNDVWWEARFTSDSRGNDYLLWHNQIFRINEPSGLQPLPELTKDITAKSVFVDRSDVLWIGTNGAGVRKYDLSTTGFEGSLYRVDFCTDLLVSQLGLPASQVPRFSPSTDSYHFRYAVDGKGLLWFNRGQPFYRLDLKTKQIQTIQPPVLPGESDERMYVPLAADPGGRIWAVYKNRAVWFDESQQHWQVFPFRFSVASAIQQAVVDDRALWLATEFHGLYRVDRATGQTRRFGFDARNPASLNSDALFCLFADPLDPNLLWLGTFGSGLGRFDKRTGQCRRFTIADGLPNNVVYSAIPDRRGSIWIGTNKGIGRLNRRTFQVQNYTTQDGILADEFNRFHFLQLPGGRILMGGLEGITAFYPDRITNDPYQPAVELTGIQINNRAIKRGADSPVGDLPEQILQSLNLPYNQNFLNLEFAALQFNKAGKNRYRYQLEDLDKDWISSERPVAVYTDLQPGKYRFLVNASNTSGIWSREVRRLDITIRPPWWATWWAYVLYSLLLISLFYIFLRIYRNRLQLRQSVELKQREVEMKTRFFTNITHEFRTPLTLILSPLEGLINELEGTNYVRRLTSVHQNARQLLQLINQLMDLSKLDAQAMKVEEWVGSPGEVVEQVVRTFQEAAGRKTIRLTCHDQKTGMFVFDPSLLERIVYNLVANALKFTPEGGQIGIHLEYNSPRPEQPEFVIRVSDTGIGIPKEQLSAIFERFYQVDPSSTRGYEGTGIGLALVNELVQLQQGRITMESEVGLGTSVTVSLPYRRVNADEKTEIPELPSTVSFLTEPDHTGFSELEREIDSRESANPNAEQTELLLVEDNDELADFIIGSLPGQYQIHRAANGVEGLRLAIERMPELIISDVLMPVMDGFEFCQKIKANDATSHIPVMLLTAKSSTENRLEGLLLGADDYITKPFLVSELQLRVRNLLEQRRLVREWVRASLLSPVTLVTLPVAETVDPYLNKLYQLIETRLDDSGFGVDELAEVSGLSRTNLYRKVKALTGLPANQFIRNYRLKRGSQLLRQGYSPSETATMVGFESHSYFTRCFRELYRMTPTEFAES